MLQLVIKILNVAIMVLYFTVNAYAGRTNRCIRPIGYYQLFCFLFKHDVSEAAFSLHLQVEPTQMGPIERANLCFQTETASSLQIRAFKYKKTGRRIMSRI
jgi:hypothetical protein